MTTHPAPQASSSQRAKIPAWLSLLVFAAVVASAVWKGERAANPGVEPGDPKVQVESDRSPPAPGSDATRAQPPRDEAPKAPSRTESPSRSEAPAADRAPVPPQKRDDKTSAVVPPEKTDEADKRLKIPNVSIRDQNGRVVYKGEINLKPTLDRIESGTKNQHRNDGSTFENREGRLPKKTRGYYREYVHPTPGVSGPGPQRVVIGEEDEVFYTHDHYKSFRRIR